MRIYHFALWVALFGCLPHSAFGQAPVNDDFASAQTISGWSGTASGNNPAATKESGEPNHANNTGGRSVWWTWTAPGNGSVTMDTVGSNFDTTLAVYTGGSVASLTPTASNDDAVGLRSKLTFGAVSGTVYHIAVDGFNGASGTITLHLDWDSSGTPVYEKLFSFADAREEEVLNKGSYPTTGFVKGSDGSFYGTTNAGGVNDLGTVFRMSSDGVLTTLVEFTDNAESNRGSYPYGGLVQGSDGNFYGTTENGGTDGFGTVFRMTPGGTLTTLVEFADNGASNKGAYPRAGLLSGTDGNFYGTTSEGGLNNLGTVFRMTPGGVLTTLVNFTGTGGGSKGSVPQAELVQGSDGNFYGTTSKGGSGDFGTVFKMTPTGTVTTLVEFTGNSASNKGSSPRAGLVQASDGNLYGTTSGVDSAGNTINSGTAFRMTQTGVLTTLVEFTGNGISNKGRRPYAGLLQGSDGNFYGTTVYGGANDFGTVFRMTPGGVVTTLVEFTENQIANKGSEPYSRLVPGNDGDFYGTTLGGGANGLGSAFKMTPDGTVTTLVEFTGRGESSLGRKPLASLAQGSDGNLYGTTQNGGADNLGTAFRMTPAGEVASLVEFTGNKTSNKGSSPSGELVEGSDGNFYGTTESGGANGRGTVFTMTPAGTITTLMEFTGAMGSFPRAGLVQGSNGSFFGTTMQGVTTGSPQNFNGAVFTMTPGGVLTVLQEFTGNGVGNKGRFPQAELLPGSDGNFYATTSQGGANDLGTIFKITPSGVLTNLVEFTGNGASNKGSFPFAGLTEGSDGNFYGTTLQGGATDNGTIFKMTPAGSLTTLVQFTGNGASNKGKSPRAELLEIGNGEFFGTTQYGGANDFGTVFKMTSAGVLTTLVEFTTSADGEPEAGLVRGLDGNLYGTTSGGDGTIYRLIFTGPPLVNSPNADSDSTDALVTAKVNARGAITALQIEYGTDEGNLSNIVPVTVNLSGFQSVLLGRTLSNLTPGTQYYYRFRAVSTAGTTFSPVQGFNTLAAPVAVSLPATEITPTSAVLNGTANARNFETLVGIEWGTDGNTFPNKLTPAPPAVTGNSAVPVSALLAGLDTGETYFYRIVATNSGGTVISGAQSFRTLTAPVATITETTALSTTRAQVTGFVDAKGSSANVSFEYGTDGVNFPNSFSATPSSVLGNDPVEVTATLTGLTQGTTYQVRIRAQGPGGTSLSAPQTFSLSILSGLEQAFPDPPPASDRTVKVSFNPPEVGAWRFAGDTEWRNSGDTAGNLTNGQRVIEFLPVPGFIRPPSEPVESTSVINIEPLDRLDGTSGANIDLERSYFQTPTEGSGSLTVLLKPDAISAPELPVDGRAQWRIVGDTAWRDSGESVDALAAGNYLVECKLVPGRETPGITSVFIADAGSQDVFFTYFTANSSGGLAPLPQSFADVTANEDLPLAYVGQIKSEAGSSTGFVVKRRVVATAGHVVFDDGTLSAITDLQWFFQRHTGELEPRPQIPRGYYLAAGYAAQRIADLGVGGSGSPGEGSAQSQALDYAALYFTEEAGRGGYGGYLASDSGADNEFLGTTGDKFLAGYPVEGIPLVDKGKLHATATFTTALTQPANGETWTTTEVRGLGGISGGPLFVRFENGSYLPAAIYLGGSNQTVVRAIDSDVVELFLRAEVSGNGGDNNTGGGITHTSVAGNLNTTQPGALRVTIEPAGAIDGNAGNWRLIPQNQWRKNDTSLGNLSPGTYRLEFRPMPGFQTPTPSQEVTVTGGQLTTITYAYVEEVTASPLETWRQTNFGTPDNTGDAADGEDPDKDGMNNIDEFTAGTDPNDSADAFRILTSDKGASSFTATAGGKAGRTYTLQRNTGLSGTWTPLTSQGPLATDEPVSLTDTSAPADTSFYRIEVSLP